MAQDATSRGPIPPAQPWPWIAGMRKKRVATRLPLTKRIPNQLGRNPQLKRLTLTTQSFEAAAKTLDVKTEKRTHLVPVFRGFAKEVCSQSLRKQVPRLPDPAWQESEAATRSPECYCYKLRERRRSLLDSNQTRMLLLHSGRVTSLEEEGLNARNPVPRMHCHASRVFAQTRLTQHSPDRELKMPSRALRVLSRTRKLRECTHQEQGERRRALSTTVPPSAPRALSSRCFASARVVLIVQSRRRESEVPAGRAIAGAWKIRCTRSQRQKGRKQGLRRQCYRQKPRHPLERDSEQVRASRRECF